MHDRVTGIFGERRHDAATPLEATGTRRRRRSEQSGLAGSAGRYRCTGAAGIAWTHVVSASHTVVRTKEVHQH
jgi:hypothetical protein